LEALGQAWGRPPADPVERDNARLRTQVAKLRADLDVTTHGCELADRLNTMPRRLSVQHGGFWDLPRHHSGMS
jgi:hypothetical protein